MPGRWVPGNMVAADRGRLQRQNEPQAAREKPGVSQALTTYWPVQLVDGARGQPTRGPASRD